MAGQPLRELDAAGDFGLGWKKVEHRAPATLFGKLHLRPMPLSSQRLVEFDLGSFFVSTMSLLVASLAIGWLLVHFSQKTVASFPAFRCRAHSLFAGGPGLAGELSPPRHPS